MEYGSYEIWWWPFVFILIAGVLPNAIWRWAGAVVGRNIDENSQWLIFVRCVATALVAAVIAQFVFFPTGAMEEFPLALRGSAAFGGFLAFLVFQRKMIVGIVVGEGILLIGYLVLNALSAQQ